MAWVVPIYGRRADNSVYRWSVEVNDWQRTSGQTCEISVDQYGNAWAVEAGTLVRDVGQKGRHQFRQADSKPATQTPGLPRGGRAFLR